MENQEKSTKNKKWMEVSQPLQKKILQQIGQPGGSPAGTHLVSPQLLADQKKDVSSFPAKHMTGKVLVVEMEIRMDRAALEKLEQRLGGVARKSRIFIKTGKADANAGFTVEVANWLGEKEVTLVGVDARTVADGAVKDAYKPLLSNGIWLVEGLDLSEAEEGYHRMICCPMNIEGTKVAPARVLIKRIEAPVSVKGFQLQGKQ